MRRQSINDPRLVVTIFAELLNPPGKFACAFSEVVFAVYDRTEGLSTYQVFAERFIGGGARGSPWKGPKDRQSRCEG
jgi:hypothetical protein